MDHLLEEHQIDCRMMKEIATKTPPSITIQTTHDKVNIYALTPNRIEELKNLLVKFAIIANVPALAMESKELLNVLQYFKSDATVVERHDFKKRLNKLTIQPL